MDVEKYTNSKLFDFFEWSFKLIIWNLLVVFIVGITFGVVFFPTYFVLKEGTLAVILYILAIVLAVFIFVPSYSTIFSCIKIFKEDGYAETFALFFDRLWDNIKSLWLPTLFMMGLASVFLGAIYVDYMALLSEEVVGATRIVCTISYYVLIIVLLIMFLMLLNVPMVVSHFRMKMWTFLLFNLRITFQKIFSTFLYLLLIVMPFLLCTFLNFLFPIWLLIGFSIPLFVSYHIARRDYWTLVKNISNINKEDF